MENFTPWVSLMGGMLIGLASAMLLLFNGRIAGISGIYGGLLNFRHNDTLWRVLFLAGLLAGGVFLSVTRPEAMAIEFHYSHASVVLAGLMVGLGTRLGSGCTSGHGVCGMGRFSPRSMVSAMVFMGVGMLTAVVVNEVLGGRI